MLAEEIKVSWIEFKKIANPVEPNSTSTKEEIEAYTMALEKSKIRKIGVVLDFVTNIFGTTKAIISSGDNKIVKIPISKLTVIHTAKVANTTNSNKKVKKNVKN